LSDENLKQDFLSKTKERGLVYSTGGTAVIPKGRAEALSKRREVTAAHDYQIARLST